MRGKNNFQPASFSMGSTYNERTTKFVGVDLTSPQVKVDLQRGVYSNNYMKKPNGKVETRFSYSQVFYSEDIVQFIALWQTNYHYIAAVRRRSETTFLGEYFYDKRQLVTLNLVDGIFELGDVIYDGADFRKRADNTFDYAFCVESNGLYWVLFDRKYFVLNDYIQRVEINEVKDWPQTHVPTVTYMGVARNAENVPTVTNVTLEYPNLLSKWRKNMYLTGLGIAQNTGRYAAYRLAGDDVSFAEEETPYVPAIEIQLETLEETLTTAHTAILKRDAISAISESVSPEARSFISDYMKKGDLIFSFDDEFTAYNDQNGYYDSTDGYLFIEETDIGLDGVIHKEADGTATLFLFSDPTPRSPGKPNLIVKYIYVSSSQHSWNVALVTNHKSGALFGKNNSLNRLWLFGDYNWRNYAIHSAEPYKNIDTEPTRGEGDFSYFPDEGIIKFGERENSIVGMVPLSPDKMMVLKDYAPNQRSMYFVSPIDVKETIISAGTYGSTVQYIVSSDVAITREEYSTTMSNTSTAGHSVSTIDAFNGDTLFLSSEKQIVGLDIEGITGDSQRVASTRSYFIDKALSKADLSDSLLTHVGNYLFLSTKDRIYATTLDSLSSETRQYEWWPIDPIEGAKYFLLTKEGRTFVGAKNAIYEIIDDPEERADTDRFFISPITYDEDAYLVASASFVSTMPSEEDVTSTAEDDLIEFKYKPSYEIISLEDGEYMPNALLVDATQANNKTEWVERGQYVFKDKLLEYQARQGATFVKYNAIRSNAPILCSFEPTETYQDADEIFNLIDANGNLVVGYLYTNSYFYMVVPSNGVYAFAHDKANGKVSLYMRGVDGNLQRLNVVYPYGSSDYPYITEGLFERRNIIKPLFVSLRLTQGKLGYDKTIDNLTIWNDSENPCELYVGALRNKQTDVKYRSALIDQGIGFDLSNADFARTNFDQNNVPQFYNMKVYPRSQQSFTICFTAMSKRNSVLGGVDILYRVKKARNKR